MNGEELGLVCDPHAFFGDLIAREMQREHLKNLLIREFLSELRENFLCVSDRFKVFYAPSEEALALELPRADWGRLEMIGERLLFGIGFFPESFRERGKRLVGLPYYIGIGKTIAGKLGQWSERWWEIDHAFSPTIRVLNQVRSRVRVDGCQIVRIREDVEKINPIKFF